MEVGVSGESKILPLLGFMYLALSLKMELKFLLTYNVSSKSFHNTLVNTIINEQAIRRLLLCKVITN